MAKYEGGPRALDGIPSGKTYMYGEPIPDSEFEEESMKASIPMFVRKGMIIRSFAEKDELESVRADLEELKEMVLKLSAKKKPGRPPKVKEDK